MIERRYERPLLNLFRKFENFDLKIRKSLCDIEFLNVCLENELTPKFLNFKLYRKDLRNTSQFQKFQQKLLNNELFDKTKKLKKLRPDFKICNDQLKSLVSFLDFFHLLNFTRNVNDKKIKKIKMFKILNFSLLDLNMKLLDSTLTILFSIIPVIDNSRTGLDTSKNQCYL